MATNPMQRRARNSFLLGILITTVVLGIIIAILVLMMMNLKNEQAELQAATVYVLTKDVQSGSEVTTADLSPVKVAKSVAPSNAASLATITEAESKGNSGNDGEESKGQNVVAKINISKGTIVTTDMLGLADNQGNDVRKQEYNTIVLPMDLITGDFIDIRLVLPSGQDFIVVSKKKVEIPKIAGVDSTDTISVELSEDEILSMSNAIIEAYMINGSKLYASKYVDAGNQEASTPTYPVNAAVRQLMNNEHDFKNILDTAWAGLVARLNNEDSKRIREEGINAAISSQEGTAENEQTKMQESITNSQTSREQYLQSLSGATTLE